MGENCKSAKKSFFHIMRSYVIVLIIPIIIGMWAYNIALHAIEKTVIESNTAVLQQSMDVLDQRLSEVDNIVEQLSWNSRVKNFLYVNKPFDGANVYKILDVRKSLYNYKLSNNFVGDYYIFYKNSNIVLGPDLTYTIPDFYEQYFKYKGLSYDEWYDKILGHYYVRQYLPAAPVMLNTQDRNMITYIRSLGYENYYQGAIVLLIDNSEVQNLLANIDLANGGWAYIADQNNQIITSLSSNDGSKASVLQLEGSQQKGVLKERINNENMLITYVTSPYNEWKYVAVQPMDIVMAQVINIKKVIISIILISIIISIIIAYLFAYRDNIPIKRILEMMNNTTNEDQNKGNALEFIEDTVCDLIDKNKSLQISLEEQIPFLRTAFFERLLRGDFYTKEQLNTIMNYTNTTLNGKNYVVVLLTLSGYRNDVTNNVVLTELNQKKVIIEEIVKKAIDTAPYYSGYLHDVKENELALILSYDCDDDKNILKRLICQIKEALISVDISVNFVVGGVFQDILDISISYQQAQQMAKISIADNCFNEILWYDNETLSPNAYYYYPTEIENKLINVIKAGDKAEVTKILNELYDKNMDIRRLSPVYIQSFIYELYGSIIKVIEQININDDEIRECIKILGDKIGSFDNIDDINKYIAETYYKICDFIDKQKRSHNKYLIEEIVRYLNNSYMEFDLCLTKVADQFNLSGVYLSQFFKEQVGANFSDYVESIRMEHAISLLSNTNLPIIDIANKVGYSSVNTFCRAFKRINNVSPSAYRKLLEGKKQFS